MSTPLEKYKEAARRFIRSGKDKEAICQYSAAVWTATLPDSGLSFVDISAALDEILLEYMKEGNKH
jgi:hypothetical protein